MSRWLLAPLVPVALLAGLFLAVLLGICMIGDWLMAREEK